MFEWLRRRISLWGWFAFEHTKRTKIITLGDYRSVHIHYTYKDDLAISICQTKPTFKSIARVSVSPSLEVDFTNCARAQLGKTENIEDLEVSAVE